MLYLGVRDKNYKMGKIYQIKLNDFSGGMVNDPRLENYKFSQLTKNFDAHTFQKKLVPFRNSESGDDAPTTSQKQAFCVALCKDLSATANPYALFALGVKTGLTNAEILYKALTESGTADLADNTWATPSDPNYQSTNTFTWFSLFVYYKKTGLIYGARGTTLEDASAPAGTNIWAFYPNAATAFVEAEYAVPSGFSHITQGLVHSKDDILYIGVDNRIIKNDNTSWSVALTLPTYYKITSLCEYGNYLAIAVAPLSGVGNSRVYIWDRDSSLSTLTESIDFGAGSLMILEELEGILVGISKVLGFQNKAVFKAYSGGKTDVFKQFIDYSVVTNLLNVYRTKQKVNNYVYFLMDITLNGVTHRALWKLGRENSSLPLSLTLDRTPNNDTAIGSVLGFFIYNDYVFFSYTDGVGDYALSKTNNTATYTASSYYETQILNGGNSAITKKLLNVGVMTEPLPSGGRVYLKYKKDEETAFTQIFDQNAEDATDVDYQSLFHYAVNIESTGVTLPEFQEIQFQIISTGGAVITGLKLEYEEVVEKNKSTVSDGGLGQN